jgi:hypothetical protein
VAQVMESDAGDLGCGHGGRNRSGDPDPSADRCRCRTRRHRPTRPHPAGGVVRSARAGPVGASLRSPHPTGRRGSSGRTSVADSRGRGRPFGA